MKKVAFVLGTRPEIIKCAPVIKALKNKRVEIEVIDMCQQNHEMTSPFYALFGIVPTVIVEAGKLDAFIGMSKLLEYIKSREFTDIVVQGDTNSALVGAIASAHSRVTLHHIEAGLRSDDYRMREEYNRIMIDRIADYLYAPSEYTQRVLEKESTKKGAKIIHTGNTINDAIKMIEVPKTAFKEKALLTMHRPENVDDPESLFSYLLLCSKILNRLKIKALFPVHPRTESIIKKSPLFDGVVFEHIDFCKPLVYRDFLRKLSERELVITDSGGVVEECCYFEIPCLIMRKSTERVEAVKQNFAMIVDRDTTLREIENFIDKFKTRIRFSPYVSPNQEISSSEIIAGVIANENE